MLYLDYSREEGEWIPNKYGGRENLEAIQFLKRFNEVVHKEFPGVVTMAEESTSWPMVSKPTYLGGLGFDFKWNMGWMNDTLEYIQKDPIYRKYHHHKLTFSMMYAFSENFVLPFSHDEVVHLKKAMLTKMPGDDWQRFANLRLLYAYQYAHPGKKLLFMGAEFGQWGEWNSEEELHWSLLDILPHTQLKDFIKVLNHVYTRTNSLYEVDFDWTGFQWIDLQDADHSILSFARYSKNRDRYVMCIFNFTPVVHHEYRVGVPQPGTYKTLINTDDQQFGGSGIGTDVYYSQEGEVHGQPAYLQLMLPPLAAIILEKEF
jgi:1,4-alpha-glucan branching enzyme